MWILEKKRGSGQLSKGSELCWSLVSLLTQVISQARRQAASRGAEFLQQLWAQDAASWLFQSASCYHSPGLGCAGARGRDSGARNVLWSQV